MDVLSPSGCLVRIRALGGDWPHALVAEIGGVTVGTLNLHRIAGLLYGCLQLHPETEHGLARHLIEQAIAVFGPLETVAVS